MRAVIYARVSTKEQTSNLSLSTQIEAGKDYCHRHGIDVQRIFVEEGESAKTADRTEFQRMLAYLRRARGHVQYVVVYALNRFARDKFDHYAVRAHLHKLGITLRSVTEPIDETSTGKLMEGILASFAQFDNDVRSERTSAGMIHNLKQGRWTFPPPLGYTSAKVDGLKNLVHDPERAPLVRQGFEAVARGATAADALEQVNRAGLTTTRGKPVSPQTWAKILTNPLYHGRILVPKWNVDAQGSFEPIVTKDLFLDAQLTLQARAHTAKVHTRANEDFPLRHFIKCDVCGVPMTGAWSRGKSGQRYAYYSCRQGCSGQRVARQKLERSWVEYLAGLRPSEEFLKVFEATVLKTWQDMTREAEARRKALQKRVEHLRARKDRLFEVYVYEQGVDKQAYDRESLKISEALTLAEMSLREARVEELDVEGLLEFSRHLALNAGQLWTEADHESRLRLQACLFPEGVKYRRGEILNTVGCPVFSDLGEIQAGEDSLVARTGFEPVLPA